MNVRRLAHVRWGRCQHESAMMLALIIVVCIAAIRLVSPEQPADPRPMLERIVASLLSLLTCFGLVIGVSLLIFSIEMIKQTAQRYQMRRVGSKLARLEPLVHDAQHHATPATLARVARLVRDGNERVREQALSAAFTLLRADPTLVGSLPTPEPFACALLEAPGFARSLAATPTSADLLANVTLGAKLGAGTSDKRLAPVTSDPVELAEWVEKHRRDEVNPEIQVSIGYDTGHLPSLVERSRFLALYVFVSTTDLKRFQALTRRPARDPNAAYGLVIRGDVVEVKRPGQAKGHRLDYVFPLPVRLSQANLAGLFRQLQLLNLGLLVACVQDACQVLMPGRSPDWMDPRRQAIARAFREFERRLVRLLRDHDRYREPGQIHRLVPADHLERIRALERYRLEECLHPHYRWVVPLYDPDTRWERLLMPLRTVEALMLHQGEVEDRDVTRGVDFIQQVRRLGYESAREIEQNLTTPEVPAATSLLPPDPFIDPAREEATRWYLLQVGGAIARGELSPETLPDPGTFRQAAAYYDIDPAASAACTREVSPEIDP